MKFHLFESSVDENDTVRGFLSFQFCGELRHSDEMIHYCCYAIQNIYYQKYLLNGNKKD